MRFLLSSLYLILVPETLGENEKLIHRELWAAALLVSISAVYSLCVTSVRLITGVSVGIDASTIIALIVNAWVFSFGDSPTAAPVLARARDLENATNVTALGAIDFLLVPLNVYEKLKLLSDVLNAVSAVLLVTAAIMSRNPKRQFVARGLGFLAWMSSVMGNVFPLLMP
jgi:hypothetical protein